MAISANLAEQTLRTPGSAFVLAEWEQEPGPAEGRLEVAPRHLHHACDEAWYVLEGRLGFLVGDREVEVGEGGAVLIPKGTPHTYWNPDPQQAARYLIVMTTKTAALIDAIHSAEDRSRSALENLFRKFDAELL